MALTNQDLITVPSAYRYSGWRAIIENSGYFFSKPNMRFFSSRILWGTLTHDGVNGAYFITSEAYSPATPRLYTLRHYEDGTVSTVGEFQEFDTRAQAVAALKRLIKEAN